MIECDGSKLEMDGKGTMLILEFGIIASAVYKTMLKEGVSPEKLRFTLHECVELGIRDAEE